jgi:hypothetical protein
MIAARKPSIASSARVRSSFDATAQHLAEIIDDVLSSVERPRERRIELIRQQVRRALNLGYKTGRVRIAGVVEREGDRRAPDA